MEEVDVNQETKDRNGRESTKEYPKLHGHSKCTLNLEPKRSLVTFITPVMPGGS